VPFGGVALASASRPAARRSDGFFSGVTGSEVVAMSPRLPLTILSRGLRPPRTPVSNAPGTAPR
jgi:hypothetical protein